MNQPRAVSLVAFAMAAGACATAAEDPLLEQPAQSRLRQPVQARGFTERVVRVPVAPAAASVVILPRSTLAAAATQSNPILSVNMCSLPVRHARADARTIGIKVMQPRNRAGPVCMAVGYDTVVSPARRSNPAASILRLDGLQTKPPRALPVTELVNNR
jgi:hypothetical protein